MTNTNQVSNIRSQTTKKITIIGAIVDFLLAIFKIIIGYLSHSHALVADGIHSFSDLLSDALVLLVIKHANSEPDEEHPYGHERFETLATLVLSILLLITGVLVSLDGINVFLIVPKPLESINWVLLVISLSIISKEGLYWWTRFYAKKIQSNLLLANAWHHRSDSLSSIVVLVGVVGTFFGYIYFDGIAALLLGLMIIYIAWKLAMPCLKELSDSAIEQSLLDQIKQEILTVDGVLSIHALRSRRNGRRIIIDVHIQVHPTLSVSEGHMVSLYVEKSVQTVLGDPADIIVHIDPENDEHENLYNILPTRSEIMTLFQQHLAQENCLFHLTGLRLHYLQGKVLIDVYFLLNCASNTEQVNLLKKKLDNICQKIDFCQGVNLFFDSK